MIGDRTVKVLVVDDDPAWIDIVKERLPKDPSVRCGFECRGVRSPTAAMDNCKSFGPTVVVADLRLPTAGDGLALYEAIRDAFPRIKVIVATSDPATGIRADCLRNPPDAFISKVGDAGTMEAGVDLLRKEIIRLVSEDASYLVEALEQWADVCMADVPVFASGSNQYSARQLADEVRKNTETGRSFRVAVAQAAMQGLADSMRPATQSAKEIIEARIREFDEFLRHAEPPKLSADQTGPHYPPYRAK